MIQFAPFACVTEVIVRGDGVLLLSINIVDLVVDVLVVVDVTLSSDSQSTSLFDAFLVYILISAYRW